MQPLTTAIQQKLDNQLIEAVTNRKCDAVERLLIAGTNPNAVNYEKETPLFIAIKYNHKDMVDLLLRSGANPNAAKATSPCGGEHRLILKMFKANRLHAFFYGDTLDEK